MEIEIKNFLGIESATIPLSDKPLVVIGPNAVGKSSIWLAIAGILSRNSNPMGLKAASGRPYIHDDHDQGSVMLVEDGVTLRQWTLSEKGMRVMPEAETDALKHVLGLTDFVLAKPAERTAAWEECFLPPNDELVAMIGKELADQIAETAVVEDVLRELDRQSWSKVCTVYESKRKECGRQWEKYTGVKYGPVKADTWMPEKWKSEWDTVTVSEARTRFEECREALRMAQGQQVIQEEDVELAAEAKRELPDLEQGLEALAENLAATKQKARILQEGYNIIRDQGLKAKYELENHNKTKPVLESTVPCPKCKTELVVGPGEQLSEVGDGRAFQAIMSAWQTVNAQMHSELEDLRMNGKDVLTEKQPVDVEVAALQKKHDESAGHLKDCRIQANKGHGVVAEEAHRAVAEAEQGVDDARSACDLIEAKANAKNAHISSLNYDAIAKALGPKGIRSKALQGNLEGLTRYLDTIAEETGWPKVSMDSTYDIKIGKRFGKLSSGSEQWRANFMLQCAIALVKEESRVVVDRADVLDKNSATQLWRLCEWMTGLGVYPIVCATGTIDPPAADWKVVYYHEKGEGWRLYEG